MMHPMHRSPPRLRPARRVWRRALRAALLLLGTITSAGITAAQDIAPCARNPSLCDMASSYRTMVAATLDSIRFRWEVAANYGDVRALTALYASDAIFVAATGSLVKGSGSIDATLGRWLSRAHNFHLTTDSFYASGDIIVAFTSMSYDADWPMGGSFSVTDRVTLVLKRGSQDRWFIQAQSGGGLPVITRARQVAEQIDAGAEETLAVRVTDATGAPVASSIVAFRNEVGVGTFEPVAALTDAQGVARTVFRHGQAPGRYVVRATASIAPDDPQFFSMMAGSGTSPAAGDSDAAMPGASPPR